MKKRKKSNSPLKVIKTSLKSICLDPETILTLNSYCKNLNLIAIHAYQFLRLYILHKYHTNQSLPKIDDKFIEHIIKTIAVGDKRGRKLNNDELTFFYENHYKQTIQGEKLCYSKYGNTIGYTATAILTCLETNILNVRSPSVNGSITSEDKLGSTLNPFWTLGFIKKVFV